MNQLQPNSVSLDVFESTLTETRAELITDLKYYENRLTDLDHTLKSSLGSLYQAHIKHIKRLLTVITE